MSRSPLAYPLVRSADTDVGGAADLQTDIMRFMAILSLCLVAIFALVQSIPLTPVEPVQQQPVAAEPEPEPSVTTMPEPAPPVAALPEPLPVAELPRAVTAPTPPVTEQQVTLTRPEWVPRFPPQSQVELTDSVAAESAPAEPVPEPTPVAEPVPVPLTVAESQGFTLRFESDAALTRAVAASHVGLYAIANSEAQRMTVSESRISFWAASTPNTFHEMEATTVPRAVVEALNRTGVDTDSVAWGVTLPGKMKSRLDALMEAHSGGSLIIGAAGDIRWEAS